ncbi:hypothetical protein GF343_03940 [Candidatus Woesearchaeota archaeon]|nr:hypothetical protein [Candidatus Woesearchaeota archaeon]
MAKEPDAEAKELMQKLADIEDRILSDEMIVETIYNSLKNLQKIFGKNSPYHELIEELKTTHKTDDLKKLVEEQLFQKRENLRIEPANASILHAAIKVHKNSVLSDYLADTGRISKRKIKEFHDFFKDANGNVATAFEKKDPEKVKKVLREYIQLLEKEEEYLKENLHKMRGDVEYLFSLERILTHELAHTLFFDHFKAKNWYYHELNEAHSFALQTLMHVFDKDYTFTEEKLEKEIKQLYWFLQPRKHAYGKKPYAFMKSFILLLYALILCDAIARKDGDHRNKKIFLQSYKVYTFGEVYALIEKAKENLKNPKYQQIIEEKLIQTSINHLKRCKNDLIANLEKWIAALPKFEKNTYFISFDKKNKIREPVPWKNVKEAFGLMVHNNLRFVVEAIDLPQIMGENKLAESYKERYLKALEEVIQKILQQFEGEEVEQYRKEKEAVDGMVAVLEAEKKHLADICKALG